MSVAIHVRKIKSGLRYRLWYGISDTYATGPLTNKELRDALLCEGFLQLINEETISLPQRLGFARKGEEQGDDKLTGPWRKMRPRYQRTRREKQTYEKRIAHAKKRLEHLLVNWDTLIRI